LLVPAGVCQRLAPFDRLAHCGGLGTGVLVEQAAAIGVEGLFPLHFQDLAGGPIDARQMMIRAEGDDPFDERIEDRIQLPPGETFGGGPSGSLTHRPQLQDLEKM
jgi:hypothetical protein